MPMHAHENPAIREELTRAGSLAAGSSNSNSHNGILGSTQDVRELVNQLSAALPRMQQLLKESGESGGARGGSETKSSGGA